MHHLTCEARNYAATLQFCDNELQHIQRHDVEMAMQKWEAAEKLGQPGQFKRSVQPIPSQPRQFKTSVPSQPGQTKNRTFQRSQSGQTKNKTFKTPSRYGPKEWHYEKCQDRRNIARRMKQVWTLTGGACLFLECADGHMITELLAHGVPASSIIAVSHDAQEVAGLQQNFSAATIRHLDFGAAVRLDFLQCGSVWLDLYGELVGSTVQSPAGYIHDIFRLFAASTKPEFLMVVTAKQSCRAGGMARERNILNHQRHAGYKAHHVLDMFYFFTFLVQKYSLQYGIRFRQVYRHSYACMRTMAVRLLNY